MRVTKIIKEYIESEVNKKYNEKLDSIPNEYQEDYNKMIKEINKVVERCDAKVKEIANRYGMLENPKQRIVSYSTYYLGDEERRQERRDLIEELNKEKKNKVSEIILSLELGDTDKKELVEILKNVEF